MITVPQAALATLPAGLIPMDRKIRGRQLAPMLNFTQAEVRKDGKRTQASVSYQEEPSGDQQCAGCAMYEVPGACSEVEGPITPAGWCRLWEASRIAGEAEDGDMDKVDGGVAEVDAETVLKYLREHAPEIAALIVKEQPGAGDVHATTALGNNGKRKAKDFLSTIAELKDGAKVVAVPAVGEEEGIGKGMLIDGSDGTVRAGYKTYKMLKPMQKADPPRSLKPKDAKTAHTPFPHDANALSNLRPDQVPRFLGALTDQDKLPTRTLSVNGLVAMQDRVDPEKVQAMRDNPPDKLPLVVRNGGRNLIADGHHRATAQWLDGAKTMDVKFMDLSAVDQAVKSAKVGGRRAAQDCPDCGAMEGEFHKAGCTAIGKAAAVDWEAVFKVERIDEDKQQIFGWASITHIDGKLVVDKQDDVITSEEMENCAYDFVINCRQQGDMHERKGVGKMIESTVFTQEKFEKCGLYAFDVETQEQLFGWWTGFFTDDEELFKDVKYGRKPELSIGGRAIRVAISE